VNIIRLQYKNYRNLQPGVLVPKKEINIIYGKNAQGKTNLLESMWLFTGGHSFRGAKDSELTAFGQDTATLDLTFFSEEREQTAQIKIQNGRRSAKLNEIEKKSAAGLVGKFCAVIFSPEHLSLVKDGPAQRRSFLDAALCQIKPAYANLLSQYNRTLIQRNTLLKDIPRHSELLETLQIWDEKLAKYGALVTKERVLYSSQIESIAKTVYSGISQEQEKLGISYFSTVFLQKENRLFLEEDFLKKLKEARKEDLAAGFSTLGPHRDDLQITQNQISARSYGSQGQQRSIVLALKLAEAQILMEKTGESPVIFLDDVMSELDAGRQDYLLNHLENRQVFITCCEPNSVKNLSESSMFRMENGVLLE
jgi:DNA replication and repair protein RecF